MTKQSNILVTSDRKPNICDRVSKSLVSSDRRLKILMFSHRQEPPSPPSYKAAAPKVVQNVAPKVVQISTHI